MCTVKTALLSTLTLASAKVLVAPEDIPFECATICGPVVELADKCSLPETVARVKRRKVEKRGGSHAHARLHDKMRKQKRAVVTNAFGQVISVPSGFESGQQFTVTTVVTITAEPTPTAAPEDQRSVTASPSGVEPPSWTVMTTVMTMEAPGEDGPNESLSLPADDAVPTTTTPLVVGNVSNDDEEFEYAETGDANALVADLEKECVCENDSFDVELVSGLCSSCIWQSGHSLGSSENIMNQCNYSLQEYTPSSDSVVDNVQVSAERPEIPEGASVAVVNDSPPSPGLGRSFTGLLAAGAACGIALFL